MNNAGVGIKGTSWDGIENWRTVFNINLFGYASSLSWFALQFTQVLHSIVNVQQTFVPVRRSFPPGN